MEMDTVRVVAEKICLSLGPQRPRLFLPFYCTTSTKNLLANRLLTTIQRTPLNQTNQFLPPLLNAPGRQPNFGVTPMTLWTARARRGLQNAVAGFSWGGLWSPFWGPNRHLRPETSFNLTAQYYSSPSSSSPSGNTPKTCQRRRASDAVPPTLENKQGCGGVAKRTQ